MELLQWDKALTLGVKEIDDDHRDLIDCYNRLSKLILSGAERKAVGAALKVLVDHAWSHFHCEETLMEAVAYPDRSAHKAAHEALLLAATMLQEKFRLEASEAVSPQRFSFLQSWVVKHVLDADRDLAQFILRQRRGSEDNLARKARTYSVAFANRNNRSGLSGDASKPKHR